MANMKERSKKNKLRRRTMKYNDDTDHVSTFPQMLKMKLSLETDFPYL